jgi:hypothetical protein
MAMRAPPRKLDPFRAEGLTAMARSSKLPTRPPALSDGSGFAAIAHRVLVRERRRPMRDVAAALGLSYAALHARVSGRVPFSPLDISLLLQEIPDLRLVDALLRHTRFVAFEKPHPARGVAGTGALQAAVGALRSLADLAEDIAAIAEGRRPSHDGAADPEARLEAVQRAVAALAFALPQFLAAQRRRDARTPAGGDGQKAPAAGAHSAPAAAPP